MPTDIRFAGRVKDASGVVEGTDVTVAGYAEGDTSTILTGGGSATALSSAPDAGEFAITLTPASSALPTAYDLRILNGSEQWWWNGADEVQVKTVQIYNADANEYALSVVRGENAVSVEVAEFAAHGAAANDDEAYLSFKLANNNATPQEWEAVRFTWVGTDVSDGSEDGRLDIGIMSGGTLDEKVIQLEPTALSPSTTDTVALGTSSLNWSDLFLDSGGVINFDGGDVTLTHAAGKLTWGGDGEVEIDFNNHEMTNVDIDSGAIDNAAIGGATPAAGVFTTLEATGLISATGGQVGFPADQNASALANVLDDYEEATWTPAIGDDSGSEEGQTYSRQVGRYTKIGNRVFFSGRLTMTGITGLTGGQSAQLRGLPFSSENTANTETAVHFGYGAGLNLTAGYNVGGYIPPNASNILLQTWDAAAGVTPLTITELSATGDLIFSGHYRI